MSKSPRPALQAPVMTALPPKPLPRTSVDDARFASAEALEAPEAVARRVEDGSIRVLNTDTVRQSAPTPESAKEPAYKRGPETGLSTKIPEYVMRQLKIAAAQRGTTIRNILLESLQKEGFEIHNEDIWDDRKPR